jgi:hypothetical protein
MITYLEYYRHPMVNQWIQIIKNHDTSTAKFVCFYFKVKNCFFLVYKIFILFSVFLIGSCPGRFIANKNNFGHLRLKSVSLHVSCIKLGSKTNAFNFSES